MTKYALLAVVMLVAVVTLRDFATDPSTCAEMAYVDGQPDHCVSTFSN